MSDTHDQTGDGEYLVVARRYRPQTFDELIGQEHVAQALKHAISSGRVGHAYLFTGARGVGKTSAARILAKALNCVHGPTPTPCNKCEVCLSVTNGDDVDVIEIDGASNRQIDDIRQLRQNVSVRPSRVRFKIYIIDEVHMLTKEAFNALLKTLEEPPEHVKFIFATTDPQKVPITILSRCQRYDFAGIESTSIESRLSQIAGAEGVTIDDEALAILASRAAGSMRDGQSLLEQLLASCDKTISATEVNRLLGIAPAQRLADLVACIADRRASDALGEFDGALAEGADPGQLIDQLIGFFRDIMAARVGCDQSQFRFALRTQADRVKKLAELLGVETLLAMVAVLDEASARLRVSVHAQTLAEMALVRLCHLHDLDDLAAIVARVEQSPPGSSVPASPPRPDRPVQSTPVRSTPSPATGRSGSQSTATPSRPSERPERASIATVEESSTTATALAPAQLSADELPHIWKQAVATLDGLIADNALLAKRIEWVDNETAELVYGADSEFSKDYCESPEHKQQIESALSTTAGGAVAIRFRLESETHGAETSVEPTRKRSRRELLTDVTNRPYVQKAIELLEGDATKIKVVAARDENRS